MGSRRVPKPSGKLCSELDPVQLGSTHSIVDVCLGSSLSSICHGGSENVEDVEVEVDEHPR